MRTLAHTHAHAYACTWLASRPFSPTSAPCLPQVYAGPLAGGARAVVLANFQFAHPTAFQQCPRTNITVFWPQIGLQPGQRARVRDLYEGASRRCLPARILVASCRWQASCKPGLFASTPAQACTLACRMWQLCSSLATWRGLLAWARSAAFGGGGGLRSRSIPSACAPAHAARRQRDGSTQAALGPHPPPHAPHAGLWRCRCRARPW